MDTKKFEKVLKDQETEINTVWESLQKQKVEIEQKILLTRGAYLMLQDIKEEMKKIEKMEKKQKKSNSKDRKES